MNIAGFASALEGTGINRPPLACPSVFAPALVIDPAPLTFVVHRTNGRESPALYHGEDKIGCRDQVVFERRIDTLPSGAELCARPAGELLFELWSRWRALQSLGALPERAGPPTPRPAA